MRRAMTWSNMHSMLTIPDVLSCTHDANAWPSDRYAGLPAPADGEKVVLWVQNSHPCPIPAGAVGLNRMGMDDIARLDREIPPFGSYALDVSELLPELAWPEQVEIRAGKHFVRPRMKSSMLNPAVHGFHPNVERSDLKLIQNRWLIISSVSLSSCRRPSCQCPASAAKLWRRRCRRHRTRCRSP